MTPDIRDVLAWLDDAAIRRTLLGVGASPTRAPASVELRDLANRLVHDFRRGELRAYRLDPRTVPLGGPRDAEQTTPADDAWEPDASRLAPKPQESLFDPRWSAPRVPVGREVQAVVTYRDIVAPISATIVISEMDGKARQPIARLRTTIPPGSGDHKVAWRRDPEEASADLEQDAASGDSGPLEYRFTVQSDHPRCHDESGPLWLTNTVEVDVIREHDRKKHQHERIVVLTDALGDEQRAQTKDGAVKFDDVLVGPMGLRVAEPRFTGLAWASAATPVGQPVDAVFEYEDAIAGLPATVVIYEVNSDGTADEIACIETKLADVAGEASVSFTRTEDEAQGDIVEDEAEGDTGPLEYRYRVVVGDARSEPSDPLWLTHTVVLDLDVTGGAPLPADAELVLVAADGSEHKSPISNGQAKFANVVCGPVTVKLNRSSGGVP